MVVVEGVSSQEHSLAEQVEADKYLAGEVARRESRRFVVF